MCLLTNVSETISDEQGPSSVAVSAQNCLSTGRFSFSLKRDLDRRLGRGSLVVTIEDVTDVGNVSTGVRLSTDVQSVLGEFGELLVEQLHEAEVASFTRQQQSSTEVVRHLRIKILGSLRRRVDTL